MIIEEVKELLGQLINKFEELDHFTDTIKEGYDELSKEKGELETTRQRLIKLASDLDQKNLSLKADLRALDQDKLELAKKTSTIDSSLNEIETRELKVSAREVLMDQKEKDFIDKVKGLGELEKRSQDLDIKESEINKKIAIDRERKENLDLREENIKQRERQLQGSARF